MKNSHKILAGIVGFALAHAMPALQAATYYDFDSIGVDLAPSASYIDGNFNVATDDGDSSNQTGYLIGVGNGEVLQSATISFQIQDSDGQALKFNISFGDVVLSELTTAITKSINISDISGDVTGTGLATLSATGLLTYTLQNTGPSSFTLLNGTLTVETADGSPGTPVSDGGVTFVLLGMGLFSLMVFNRFRVSAV